MCRKIGSDGNFFVQARGRWAQARARRLEIRVLDVLARFSFSCQKHDCQHSEKKGEWQRRVESSSQGGDNPCVKSTPKTTPITNTRRAEATAPRLGSGHRYARTKGIALPRDAPCSFLRRIFSRAQAGVQCRTTF